MRVGFPIIVMGSVCGTQTEGRGETGWIEQIIKAGVPLCGRNSINPRNIADQLANILHHTVIRNNTIHIGFIIPQTHIDLLEQMKSIISIGLCGGVVIRTARKIRQCTLVCVHIRVDRRTQTVTGNGIFHTVAVTGLTVHTVSGFVVIPCAVNFTKL